MGWDAKWRNKRSAQVKVGVFKVEVLQNVAPVYYSVTRFNGSPGYFAALPSSLNIVYCSEQYGAELRG